MEFAEINHLPVCEFIPMARFMGFLLNGRFNSAAIYEIAIVYPV